MYGVTARLAVHQSEHALPCPTNSFTLHWHIGLPLFAIILGDANAAWQNEGVRWIMAPPMLRNLQDFSRKLIDTHFSKLLKIIQARNRHYATLHYPSLSTFFSGTHLQTSPCNLGKDIYRTH